MTNNERFDQALVDLLSDMSATTIINIPGVYEAVSEELNNAAMDEVRLAITDEAYRSAAADIYEREGEIEIDPGAPISHGDDPGAYVQAWVWVYDDQAATHDTGANQ